MDTNQQVQPDEILRLLRKGRKANSDVRIDYSQWSEEARASPVAFLDEFYSHSPYNCRACARGCVFSAEDQKYVREVLKKRLEWWPSLCEDCYAVRVGLERERQVFVSAWADRGAEIRGDERLIARWLVVLETLPKYGVKRDSAKITQLQKLLLAAKGGA